MDLQYYNYNVDYDTVFSWLYETQQDTLRNSEGKFSVHVNTSVKLTVVYLL